MLARDSQRIVLKRDGVYKMAADNTNIPTRRPLPIILIRGFGGLDVEDEQELAYQGFNIGTVYPLKRGANFIYEGFILRLLKSNLKYTDATNIIGYYASNILELALHDAQAG